jgi:hypothetical protein
MSLCGNTGSEAARFTRQQLPVRTSRFAFRAPEEDDQSVKMSNTISRRTSALSPALRAPRPQLKRAQNHNFYSIQISPFLPTPDFQVTEKKALPFFYSIQMKSYQSLLANHQSLLAKQPPVTKTRRTP